MFLQGLGDPPLDQILNFPVGRVPVHPEFLVIAAVENHSVNSGVGQDVFLPGVQRLAAEFLQPIPRAFIEDRRIPERQAEKMSLFSQFRRIQSMMVHLPKNPGQTFPQRPHNARIDQNAGDDGVPGIMDFVPAQQLLDPHRPGEVSGTANFQAVVEHPDFNGIPFESIIPVGDGVNERLFPGKREVFEFLTVEEVLQDNPLLDTPPR